MARRLCTLLLMFACALAPALPALEAVARSDAGCGCNHSCCGMNDCAPPPAPARTTTTLNVVGTVEARAITARPASRATAVPPRSFFTIGSVSSRRALFALRVRDAVASAPLYQVHCTFLI